MNVIQKIDEIKVKQPNVFELNNCMVTISNVTNKKKKKIRQQREFRVIVFSNQKLDDR